MAGAVEGEGAEESGATVGEKEEEAGSTCDGVSGVGTAPPSCPCPPPSTPPGNSAHCSALALKLSNGLKIVGAAAPGSGPEKGEGDESRYCDDPGIPKVGAV